MLKTQEIIIRLLNNNYMIKMLKRKKLNMLNIKFTLFHPSALKFMN